MAEASALAGGLRRLNGRYLPHQLSYAGRGAVEEKADDSFRR